MAIAEIKNLSDKNKDDLLAVLEDFKTHIDGVQGFVIIGLNHDGSQIIRSTSMNHLEKSFLGMFFIAWVTQWFELGQK